MPLLFSTYLKKNHIEYQNLSDFNTKNYHLWAWITQLSDSLNVAEVYLPFAYSKLGDSFQKYINKYGQEYWNNNITEKIENIDKVSRYFYMKVLDYAIAKSYKKPIKSIMPYPFNPSHSGVSMRVYVVQESGNTHSIYPRDGWSADDFLSCPDTQTQKKKKEDILRAIQQETLLSSESKNLITHRINQFHAEDYWFSTQLNFLISYLEAHRDSLLMSTQTDDEVWIQQLKAPSRIEFIVSTSPCMDCRSLFTDMRRILNRRGFILPMIIFSNSPENNSEISYSQIALVGFDDNYFNTNLVAYTPYTQSRLENPDFKRMHGFFNRDTQIFNKFEPIISQIMPKMIILSEEVRNSFIDDLFNFFGHSFIINQNSLSWFIYFLERLPEFFYTSKTMTEYFKINDINAYSLGKRMLPKTRVELFLRPTQQSKKIDLLNANRPQMNHLNLEPQSFEYIEKNFRLQIAPYIENEGVRSISDHIHSRLESFYLKKKDESDKFEELKNSLDSEKKYAYSNKGEEDSVADMVSDNNFCEILTIETDFRSNRPEKLISTVNCFSKQEQPTVNKNNEKMTVEEKEQHDVEEALKSCGNG